MSKNNTPKKKSTGRPCSVCSHAQAEEINSMISESKSLRAISLQFGMSHTSVNRHTEKCLNLEISALIKEKKIKNAINHYEEIAEQLEFAKDLRISAREYLTDPETGRLILIPRSDEIQVMYEDYADCSGGKNPTPKKKTDSLDVLLDRAESGNVGVLKTIVRHVDIRSFALDAIKTTDLVLDKIARKEGLYQQDKTNDDELAQLKKQIERAAEKMGTDYKTELGIFLSEYSDNLRSDLKTKLASELVN